MTVMERLSQISAAHCDCGRPHPMLTKEALVVPDAPEALRERLVKEPPKGKILVICDSVIYDILGKRTVEMLQPVAPVETLVLDPHHLHANEWSIGAAMMEISPETARVVAVGTGTINDIARYAAYSARVPYDIIGTSPSMDGFTSAASPMLRRGMKITFYAIAPTYSLLDLPTMRESPANMIAAGLGDMLGKYTALCDWKVAKLILGEYFCPDIHNLMYEAVEGIVAEAKNIPARGAQAITNLGDGLLLSGAAMQMANDTRPASGAEHYLSHFWEMRQLANGGETALHGDKVGVGTLITLDYYKRFFEKQRPFKTVDTTEWNKRAYAAYGTVADEVFAANITDPLPAKQIYENAIKHWDALKAEAETIISRRDEFENYLKLCGGPVTPAEVDVNKEDVRDALLFSKEIKTRFTVMRLAAACGVHEEIVDEVMEGLYGR